MREDKLGFQLILYYGDVMLTVGFGDGWSGTIGPSEPS